MHLKPSSRADAMQLIINIFAGKSDEYESNDAYRNQADGNDEYSGT